MAYLKRKDVALDLQMWDKRGRGKLGGFVKDTATKVLKLDAGEGGLAVAMHHSKLVDNQDDISMLRGGHGQSSTNRKVSDLMIVHTSAVNSATRVCEFTEVSGVSNGAIGTTIKHARVTGEVKGMDKARGVKGSPWGGAQRLRAAKRSSGRAWGSSGSSAMLPAIKIGVAKGGAGLG